MHFSYSYNLLHIMHTAPVVLKSTMHSRNSVRLVEQSTVYEKEDKTGKVGLGSYLKHRFYNIGKGVPLKDFKLGAKMISFSSWLHYFLLLNILHL